MHDALSVHVHRIAARKTACTTTAAVLGLYVLSHARTSVDASVAILSFATAMQCTALRERACALKLRTRPSASCSAALLPAPPTPRATLSSVVVCPLLDEVLPATSFRAFRDVGQAVPRPSVPSPTVRVRERSHARVEMRALAVRTGLTMNQSP